MTRLVGAPPGERRRGWCPCGAHPLLFVAALLPHGQNGQTLMCWLLLVAAAINYLAEAWAPRSARHLRDTLSWLQVGVVVRWIFREAALIVLLARVLIPDWLQFEGADRGEGRA